MPACAGGAHAAWHAALCAARKLHGGSACSWVARVRNAMRWVVKGQLSWSFQVHHVLAICEGPRKMSIGAIPLLPPPIPYYGRLPGHAVLKPWCIYVTEVVCTLAYAAAGM